MAATSLDFDSSTSFALLDDSIAVIQSQCLTSLVSTDISYSLNAVFRQRKSVKIEAAYTLGSDGLAVIAQLDGADYLSLLILKRQEVIHRVDDILHNYYLKKDFLLFTRLAFPGRIQKLCFNNLIELTLIDSQGFCTPLRQRGNTLYYIQETSNHSQLRAMDLINKYDCLLSNEHQVICHSESGLLLKKVNKDIFFSCFDLKDTIDIHDCSDCFISSDAIYTLKKSKVYKSNLNGSMQELVANNLNDHLLYADNRWVLTNSYDYLNNVTYVLYDQLNKEKIKIGTPALFTLDSISYRHLQSNYTFDCFRANNQSLNRSVIISVYEGFDEDNEPLISEQDQKLWLNKGHDIIVFNAFNKIKAATPSLSKTQAKLQSLAVLASLSTDCKKVYGYSSCLIIGVSHGGMMALSCTLTYPDAADAIVAISPLVNLQAIHNSDYYPFWRKEFELDEGSHYLQLCPTYLLNQTKEVINGIIITFEGDKIIDSKEVTRFYSKCKVHNLKHVHFKDAQGHATYSDKASVNEGYNAVYNWIYDEIISDVKS